MRKLLLCCVLIGIVAVSCRKDFEGDINTQTTPETYAVVDSVRRDSNNLLTTTVEARWWGESKKGFIKGYEVSIDNQVTWTFTKDQKGTFLLSLPFGTDRGNLPIYVRAIDNVGQTDPTPAVMTFPVKNTPPTLQMDYLTGRKTSTLPAFRYYWIASDVDGAQDIQSIEIVLNDTNKTPLVLSGNTTAASFVAQVSGGVFDTELLVYPNTKTTPLPDRLTGVNYNALNKIFIRSVDRVGAKSNWVIDSITIKKPVSDFIIVNDYHSAKNIVRDFYATQLNALGTKYGNFDTLESITDLPPDNFTAAKLMAFYSKIIWFTDNPGGTLDNNGFLIPGGTLPLAQQITETFFANGGRMFLVSEMPDDFPATSSYLGFTPAREVVVPPVGGKLRMDIGQDLYPHIAGNGWPTLKATAVIGARPFYTFSQASGSFDYDSICRADLKLIKSGTSLWTHPTNPSNVMSKRKNVGTGKTELIFLTLPLHKLNGNNNMDSLFRKALINELEF